MTQIQMAQYFSDRMNEVSAKCGIKIEQHFPGATGTYHGGEWLYSVESNMATIWREGIEQKEEIRATKGSYLNLRAPSDFNAELKAAIGRLRELS